MCLHSILTDRGFTVVCEKASAIVGNNMLLLEFRQQTDRRYLLFD